MILANVIPMPIFIPIGNGGDGSVVLLWMIGTILGFATPFVLWGLFKLIVFIFTYKQKRKEHEKLMELLRPKGNENTWTFDKITHTYRYNISNTLKEDNKVKEKV